MTPLKTCAGLPDRSRLVYRSGSMRGPWLTLVLAVSALLGAVPARAQELAMVVLADRVPHHWLTHDSDRLPLEPARQRQRMPRRCRTRGGYRAFCQGPLVVPEPSVAAASLASRLGLAERATAMLVLHQRPLDEWMAAVADLDQESRLTFPVPVGHMGRGFGYTRDEGLRGVRHDGVDIGAPEGSPIVAARDALVMYAGNEVTGMGNVLVLLHHDGASTLYAHCRALHVTAGEYVARGETIAEVGQTGFANAPHLHFEWRIRGWLRDPSRHFIPRASPG